MKVDKSRHAMCVTLDFVTMLSVYVVVFVAQDCSQLLTSLEQVVIMIVKVDDVVWT